MYSPSVGGDALSPQQVLMYSYSAGVDALSPQQVLMYSPSAGSLNRIASGISTQRRYRGTQHEFNTMKT